MTELNITLKEKNPKNNFQVIKDAIEFLILENKKDLERENTISEKLKLIPNNEDENLIQEKVKLINELYDTQIKKHCKDTGKDYDSYTLEIAQVILVNGISIELIESIRNKTHDFTQLRAEYSFITKYCNWHEPTKFIIYDSHVRRAFVYYHCIETTTFFKNMPYVDFENYSKKIIDRFELSDILIQIESYYKSVNPNDTFLREFLIGNKILDKYLFYFSKKIYGLLDNLGNFK